MAASSYTPLDTFSDTKVNVDLANVSSVQKNGKGYEGGALNLGGIVSLKDEDGNDISFAPMKDGSRNNDFVQVDVMFDSGNAATSGAMVYSSGATDAVADYVATDTPKWDENPNLSDTSTVFMGANDLKYSTTVIFEPATPFALEPGSTPMSKDSLSGGKVVGGGEWTATSTVYSLLPWIQWHDTQVNLGEVNDFSKNIGFNSPSPWRWAGGYSTSNASADKVPADGEDNLVSENVTAVPQLNWVNGHGEEPSKNPGDNAGNKVTDFAPTRNSDFTVTADLTGDTSGHHMIARTKNAGAPDGAIEVASSMSNTSLSPAISVVNGFNKGDGYDFRVWVIPPTVNELPLTGGVGTGRTILLVAASAVMLAVALAAASLLNRRKRENS
jgi:hypothetical protein